MSITISGKVLDLKCEVTVAIRNPSSMKGYEVQALIDTGATDSYVAADVAERLALEGKDEWSVCRFGQNDNIPVVEARISILGTAEGHEITIEGLFGSGSIPGKYGCIIGMDSLKDSILTVDRTAETWKIEK